MNTRRLLSILSVSVVLVFIAGGVFLISGTLTSADDPLIDGEYKPDWQPGLQRATPSPTPDTTGAVAIDEGAARLAVVPGLGELIDAVDESDLATIMSLMTTVEVECSRRDVLGCAEDEELVARIPVESSRMIFFHDPARIEALIAGLLAAGDLDLTIVTRLRADTTELGNYYVTFTGVAVDAGSIEPNLYSGPINGLALKVSAASNKPVREVSVLTPTWGPLEWLQSHDASKQVLVTPESVDGFVRIDD
jgi:hypothetical protein